MKIREITDVIESFAPLSLQESFDNAGLIVGRYDDEVNKALIAVDVTDEVMDEAEREGCDMIITHHPVVFHAMKRFNSSGYVERCVERAIKQGIALYACHTNLDSVHGGTSWYLAGVLGLTGISVLQPSADGDTMTGFGVVGDLGRECETGEFLKFLKERLNARVVRHSDILRPTVSKVAICTGAGAFLIEAANRSGADIYVTSDLKYNDFMSPDRGMVVADVGHFESEYCSIDILFDILSKKLLTFAVRKSGTSRNPVNYMV